MKTAFLGPEGTYTEQATSMLLEKLKLPEADKVAKRIEVDSTALAMKQISEQKLLHVAAIGAEIGLHHYGLKILQTDIQNSDENSTEFLLLARRD